jgi:hypothetical protein
MRCLSILIASLVTVSAAAADQPTEDQLRSFESTIRPLLAEHCYKCHGEKKQWSGLRLDSREALLAGGDLGPAVVPGQPNESRLIVAVRHTDDDLKMPPDSKLTDQQIADLSRWVEMGAPFPDTTKIARQADRNPNHWSFKPPGNVALPQVGNSERLQSPIDAFIVARLESAGLAPAPPADKRTLIRRLTFDLVGLPPTPAEIEAFLADGSPDAVSRVVDRLLSAPQYGERWGRHWLDVARYADSNGLDENIAHGNAWRYRDYVVEALNSDKPYDRFVIEQVAGDLLPAAEQKQRHEQLIATSFLAIGPKVLAEVDEAKMQMDIVDEQIDTFGRAFLGLTLGCARCHDHKFDPIDTADYYGLAGIFKSTAVMEHYKKIARWHENVLPSPETDALKAKYDEQLAAKKQELASFIATADEGVRESLSAGASIPDKLEAHYSAETKAQLKKLRDELTQLEKNPPDLPAAMGAKDDKIADEPIRIRGNPLKLGAVVSRHVPPTIRGPSPPEFTSVQSGRLELAQWLTSAEHPLTARVLTNRLWRWHFGSGLVHTTDNFGLLGEQPSHPELLDWLARRFIADGWSIKNLHRLILSSSTYQQSSRNSEIRIQNSESGGNHSAFASDAENRLLSRFPIRRLEAEELRDALLAVSDQLDFSFGGSLLNVKNRAFFFDHTSKDMTDYTSRRRSLYLPVVRNNVFPVFQLLDFPDPATATSDRSTTTIAPQALLMLNSDLVIEAAEQLAARITANHENDARGVNDVYQVAYGRTARPREISASLEFITRAAPSRALAWTAFCHTILASNEFAYVQ